MNMCSTSCCCQPKGVTSSLPHYKFPPHTGSEAREPGEEMSGIRREMYPNSTSNEGMMIRGQEFMGKGCGQEVATGSDKCSGGGWSFSTWTGRMGGGKREEC